MPPKNRPRSIKPADEGASSKSTSKFRDEISKKRAPGGRISAACEACKKRKTKCSGRPPPCLMCEQLDTPCVTDLTLDMRRRTALQRTVEESRGFQDTLESVIEVIRNGDGAEIDDLVQQIKRTSESTNIIEILQVKFQSQREQGSRNSDRQLKREVDNNRSFMLNDDGPDTPNASPLNPEFSRKRPLSLQEDEVERSLRPLSESLQPHFKEERGGGFLTSRYLPILSKLRTMSDIEATRVLHDLKTYPVEVHGVAVLDPLDGCQSHSLGNFRPGCCPRQNQSGKQQPSERRNWHPSLQVSELDDKSAMVGPGVQPLRNDQVFDASANRVSHPILTSRSQRAIYLRLSFKSASESCTNSKPHQSSSNSRPGQRQNLSVSVTKLSLTSSLDDSYSPKLFQPVETAGGIQAQTKIQEGRQLHEKSHVLEVFGDLRALCRVVLRQQDSFHENSMVQSFATIPRYFIQPRIVIENSPLSKVYTGFRDAARQMVVTGTPALDIISGSDVVVDLFLRERIPSDTFTCATWACELCRSFGEINDILRLAWSFLLARMMRWMIFPTPQTYADVPECQRPTATQCFLPHVPAVDLHPIPAFRDMLCNNVRDWITPLTSVGISCNWPYSTNEALETDPVSGSTKISQRFADHVSNCENWSLNSHAVALYPELAGKVRIEDG